MIEVCTPRELAEYCQGAAEMAHELIDRHAAILRAHGFGPRWTRRHLIDHLRARHDAMDLHPLRAEMLTAIAQRVLDQIVPDPDRQEAPHAD